MFSKLKRTDEMNKTELEFMEVFELLRDVKKELREIQSITNTVWAKTLTMNATDREKSSQQEVERNP
mgnify:CR=1 FL=1